MERRKDTEYKCERLPREYMGMIEGVFNKNFASRVMGRGKKKEVFVVFGEIYPDEILVAVSLKNPINLRMTTCYASIDFPPPSLKGESGAPGLVANSASEAVQITVNSCVDVIASFFQTYFQEERPVDYDVEYRQDWVIVDVDKTTKVYLRINRDNLELEAASDAFLAQHEAMEDRDESASTEEEDSGVSPGLDPNQDPSEDVDMDDIEVAEAEENVADDEEEEQEILDEEMEPHIHQSTRSESEEPIDSEEEEPQNTPKKKKGAGKKNIVH